MVRSHPSITSLLSTGTACLPSSLLLLLEEKEEEEGHGDLPSPGSPGLWFFPEWCACSLWETGCEGEKCVSKHL